MESSPPKGFQTMKQSLEAMQRGGTTFFNVLGWVVDFRPPLKTAMSQMKSTCSIRDTSSEDTLEIAVFRGRQEDLPQISSPGDIVLFRDIRPNIQRQGTAWTNTGSSWTVFPYAELADRTSSAMANIPHTSYPPSWHPSAEELAYVRLLHKKSGVYAPSLNAGISTLSTAANLSVTQNNSANTLAEPRGLKFRLIEKVKAKEFVDLVVQVVKIYSLDHTKVEAYVTDYTENKDLYKYSQESEERDGDRFTYIKDAAKEWRGPWGQRTVQICCFHHHGYKIKEFNEDDVVELKNVHIKYGKEILRLEGAIYKDHIYPDRVQVFRADKDDNRVKALMRRRTEYWEQAKADGLRCPGDHDESKKRKHELQKGKGKKRSKTDAARQATKIAGSLRAVELKSSFLNTHVQCANRTHPIKAVADILHNDNHVVETPKRVQYRLPFQNVKYHTTIRVVDYFPDKLEDFTCLLPVSDDRDSDEESIDGRTTSQRRNGQKWGWQFGLIVEDGRQAPKGAQKERLELYLFCDDAEFLLKLDAKDLRKNADTLQQLREKLFTLWGNLEEVKLGPNQGVDESTTAHSCKPFNCWIKEYGVHTTDRDCSKLGPCEPEHWERKFRMFQTTIL